MTARVTVAGLLADRRRRWLLSALAAARGEPLSIAQLVQRTTSGDGPRAVREALRSLRDMGVVREVPGATTSWAILPAGAELANLARVLTRLAVKLVRLPHGLPEHVQDDIGRRVMAHLGDPVVVATVRALAVRPRTASELEELCDRIAPRRTVYRRLRTLVDVGAIERHALQEMPRRTQYEIADHWRPAALMLLLATWWEWRHADPRAEALASDLESLVHALAPLVTPPRHLEGRQVRWVVTQPGEPVVLAVGVADGVLRVETVADPDSERAGDAEVIGAPPSWCAVLVSLDASAMTVRGDQRVAAGMMQLLRSVLLAPLSS
jgi:DNA-binding HxlR family transcriptional regulator